ncbi:molybdopterin-dependent oxidoreductase [Nocardia sp. 004]|uniref:molybdopterin-dependent oxidoreductase n=1 Tax=Nocardia sp. 004 TaxID=3385978 RepID=UPI0039A3D329
MSARGPEVASRVGIALGIAILVCFGTGLLSHWIQHPPTWFWWPTRPVWLYRFTQGTHVIAGVIAIPLLLVKLWAVYPRLFQRPILGSPLRIAERGSIAVLVGSVIFQLSTGLANIAQYYPWKFFFPTAHYAMAYIAAGALAVHLAVKLPVIREALRRPIESPTPADQASPEGISPAHAMSNAADRRVTRVSRRTVLNAAWVSAAVAGLAVAGQTVPLLRWVSFLAPRSGHGPQGVPVNRSAAAAGVAERARDPGYRLLVRAGDRQREFTRTELAALPQTSARLPIACVEGWSASAHWSGVRLRDVLALVGYTGGDVRCDSLETSGIYRSSVLPQRHVLDRDTLIAMTVNGEILDLDHGYPCRLIAPNRPGVLQTKWLSRIEVLP